MRFLASRGAIVNGVVTQPTFVVLFYVGQNSTPQALVINRKYAPKQNHSLPNGTIIRENLEVEYGTILEYLVVFESDIDIEFPLENNVSTILPSTSSLYVYFYQQRHHTCVCDRKSAHVI
nr:unnamed protein product [Spirometra erinaceieuropaei]